MGGFIRHCRLVFADIAVDNNALDLVGALKDLVNFCITEAFLNRILSAVAITAEYLDRVRADVHSYVGRKTLRCRKQFTVNDAGIRTAAGMPDQLSCRFQLCVHIGQHKTDTLKFADWFSAKRSAYFCVVYRAFVSILRIADRARTRRGPRPVQAAVHDCHPFALRTDQIGFRHAAVFKNDVRRGGSTIAQFIFMLSDRNTGRFRFYQEAGDPLVSQAAVFGRKYQQQIGDAAVRDKALRPFIT